MNSIEVIDVHIKIFLIFFVIVFSETPQDGTVQTDVSASLLQIQDELSAVRARLENLELEKMSLAGQLKNCCRNDSFYANLVQDQVNLALGQVR